MAVEERLGLAAALEGGEDLVGGEGGGEGDGAAGEELAVGGDIRVDAEEGARGGGGAEAPEAREHLVGDDGDAPALALLGGGALEARVHAHHPAGAVEGRLEDARGDGGVGPLGLGGVERAGDAAAVRLGVRLAAAGVEERGARGEGFLRVRGGRVLRVVDEPPGAVGGEARRRRVEVDPAGLVPGGLERAVEDRRRLRAKGWDG